MVDIIVQPRVDIVVQPPNPPPVSIGVPDTAPPEIEILGGPPGPPGPPSTVPGPPGPPGPPAQNVLAVYTYEGGSYVLTGGSFFIGPEVPEADGLTPVEGDLWVDMDVP